jgi:hypothetical protein
VPFLNVFSHEELSLSLDLRKDEEFREVIITASIDFNAPKGLCMMLRECFDEAEQDKHRNPENMAAMQIKLVQSTAHSGKGIADDLLIASLKL